MRNKGDNELYRELAEAEDLTLYLKRNEGRFNAPIFSELLESIFGKRKMAKAKVAEGAGVSTVYVYQIFNGKRSPSRDKLISICVGMEASVDECQALLKAAEMALLSPSCRREAVILYGLIHGMTLLEINDNLYDAGEKTL